MSDSGYAWGDRVTISEPFHFRGFNQEPQEEEPEEDYEPTKGDLAAGVFNQHTEEE